MQTLNFKSLLLATLVLFSSAVFFSSCKEDETPPIATNVTETLADYSDLSTLLTAIERANMTSFINGSAVTLFAPSNAAFDTFFADNGFTGIGDVPVDVLNNLLSNHVVDGNVASSALTNGYVRTLAEGYDNYPVDVLVNVDNGVTLNGTALVDTPDIDGLSGTIHIINEVLTIPDVVDIASANGAFTQLTQALTDADLLTTLRDAGPYTVFAPIDALNGGTSWDAALSLNTEALREILLDHVATGANVRYADLDLTGTTVTTSGAGVPNEFTIVENSTTLDLEILDAQSNLIAKILSTDVQGSNGVVHVIDRIIVL